MSVCEWNLEHGMGAYMRRINQIPLLSEDEEYDLAHRLQYFNDLEAAHRLILSHLRLAFKIARSYFGYGFSEEDIVQQSNIGLMRAVKRFDLRVGVRLASFAKDWIRAEIHEFILSNWRLVKIATTKAQRKLFFNLRKLSHSIKTHGRRWLNHQEIHEIAHTLHVKPKEVRHMEARLSVSDDSLDAQTEDQQTDQFLYLADQRHNPAQILEQDNWDKQSTLCLERAMDGLEQRDREIVQQRWLNESKATLHDLAKMYNISPERIRQLEYNAFKKIRLALEKEHLSPFKN